MTESDPLDDQSGPSGPSTGTERPQFRLVSEPKGEAESPDENSPPPVESRWMEVSKYLLIDGTPWSEVVGRALHVGASYVVVGAHVHEKPEHRILGSTVQRILRHAPCPVLVVRPELASEDQFHG